MIAIENLDLLHLERRMKTLKACLGELNVLNNQVSPNLYLKLIEEKADLENLIDDIRNKQALRKIHD